MCGLVGMAGDIDHREKKNFRNFLDACQTRGRDSTGVIKVTKELDYTWVKRVGPPAFLFDTKTYDDEIEKGGDCAALIGHCRHKTSGVISNKTAHPFDFPKEGICGVHNGTLRSYHELDGYTAGKVDSEILFEHLAKNGPEDTFPKITGAWACVWWNNQEKTLNFIRNDERPLYLTWSHDSRQLYWASEVWMFGAIERLGEAQGTVLWDGGKDKKKFIELPTNQLWTFELKMGNILDKTKSLFNFKEIRKIEGKKIVSVGNSNAGHTSVSWGGGSRNYYRNPRGENWTQDPKTGRWERNAEGQGGSVPDPFRQTFPDLNDPLPESLLGSPGEKTNSKNTPVSFIPPSQKSLVLLPPSMNSNKSEKSSKSQRPVLSVVGQKTNKKKDSSDCIEHTSGSNVDHRTVAGIPYITDRKNGKEYSIHEFEENTGGICCHCEKPIGDLAEVFEIFDDTTFLCQTCVTEPPISACSNKVA